MQRVILPATDSYSVVSPTPELRFTYVVKVLNPQLIAHIAFRRVGKADEQELERKILKCPHCKSRLIDAEFYTQVELHQHPVHEKIKCQLYTKCGHCGSEIGIILS